MKIFQRAAERVRLRLNYAERELASVEATVRGDSLDLEATGIAQSCVNLWEAAFRAADIRSGSPLVDRPFLSHAARSLALRGEILYAIRDDVLAPITSFDLVTRGGRPIAFRGQVVEAQASAPYETLLAGEAIHALINPRIDTPWLGQSPLRAAKISAQLVTRIEKSLFNVWSGPVGAGIVPHPADVPNLNELTRATNPSLEPRQGGTLFVRAARVLGGNQSAPIRDWEKHSLSPNIDGMGNTVQQHETISDSIRGAFGIPPGIFGRSTPGNSIREALRHLSFATLAPLARMLSDELSDKLGTSVTIDVTGALGTADFVARARALKTISEIEGEIPPERLRLLGMNTP